MRDIVVSWSDWMDALHGREVRLGMPINLGEQSYRLTHEDDPKRDGRFIVNGNPIGYVKDDPNAPDEDGIIYAEDDLQ